MLFPVDLFVIDLLSIEPIPRNNLEITANSELHFVTFLKSPSKRGSSINAFVLKDLS